MLDCERANGKLEPTVYVITSGEQRSPGELRRLRAEVAEIGGVLCERPLGRTFAQFRSDLVKEAAQVQRLSRTRIPVPIAEGAADASEFVGPAYLDPLNSIDPQLESSREDDVRVAHSHV